MTMLPFAILCWFGWAVGSQDDAAVFHQVQPGFDDIANGASEEAVRLRRLEGFASSTVEVLNLAVIDTDLDSFNGGFTHGDFGYFVPYDGNQGEGKVVRVNLTSFTVDASDILSLPDIGVDFSGFNGGFTDGIWGYLVPYSSAGLLVRFNLMSFSTEGIETLDLMSFDSQLTGFSSGFTDGTFGYLVPDDYQKVARFNLMSFDDVQVLDTTTLSSDYFKCSFLQGTFGYLFSMSDFAEVVRVDLTTFALDDAQSGNLASEASPLAIRAAFAQGPFGFASSRYGEMVRFELESFPNIADTIHIVDLSEIDEDLGSFYGGFSDGTHGYWVPNDGGKMVRFHLEDITQIEVLNLVDQSTDLADFFFAFISGSFGYLTPEYSGRLTRVRVVEPCDYEDLQQYHLAQFVIGSMCDDDLYFNDQCLVDCDLGYTRINDPTTFQCGAARAWYRPGCDDTDAEATDQNGASCRYYLQHPQACGSSDDEDFTSSTMCCGCGGGVGGDLVTCEPIECTGNFPQTGLGNIHNCSGATFGQECVVSCSPGYIGDFEMFTCEQSGNLSTGTVPTCTPTTCAALNLSSSEFHSNDCDMVVTGEMCMVECGAGYRLEGESAQFTCGTDGFVTGSYPTCTELPCDIPERGDINSDNCIGLTVGQSCEISCADGFNGTLSAQWTCVVTDGVLMLQGTEQTCTPLACVNGIPSGDEYIHDCEDKFVGDHCTVSCADSYSGEAMNRTCGTEQSWIGDLPVCVPLAEAEEADEADAAPAASTKISSLAGMLILLTISCALFA